MLFLLKHSPKIMRLKTRKTIVGVCCTVSVSSLTDALTLRPHVDGDDKVPLIGGTHLVANHFFQYICEAVCGNLVTSHLGLTSLV